MHTSKDYSIAVVGGGIGGLCCAVGLRHQGINVQIYEAAPAFAEIGAGVSFGPNSIRAMELIDPKIKGAFDKCVTNNAEARNKTFWFSFNDATDHSTKFGKHITDMHCETGQTSVHRARYLDEIIKLVPKEVSNFGKRLDNIVDHGDHVVLHFQDGTTAQHSAVIACDGVKSRARRILLGENDPAVAPQFSGKYAYRGLLPMDEAAKLLGDDLARNSQLYMGRGGHILTFPIEKGETLNVVAFSTKKDGQWTDEQWVKPMQRADMEADFGSEWPEAAHSILKLMQKPDLWALFDHAPARTYFKGRLCLLGDSAHASTPHQGAGAGMAIEDALVMSRVMAHVEDAKDITRAFQAYDTVRRPRSQRLVTTSREAGMLYEMQQEGVGDDLEKIKENLGTRMKWIWDIDLEDHVREAEKVYEQLGGK